MKETSINSTVSGGAVGVAGAQMVRIENLYVGSAVAVEPAKPPGHIPACPYPGLAYFGPEDAARFFGREKAIKALVSGVEKKSFTALIGASGSGKTSVVLAGLWPRLESFGRWRSTYFRVGTEPDKNPFAALARALEPLTGERPLAAKLKEVQGLAEGLAEGSITLTNVIGQCRAANPTKRLLLIADQFEEVFTFVGDDALRNRFIDSLIDAFVDTASGVSPDICLVLTLRADFYNASLRYRRLADRLQDHVANLGPMTRDELREAVVEPAETLNVKFEPGLVETILDDVERRPGSLPLLQFALREMWGQLKTPEMTRTGYDAIGSVEGALANRAQAIFETATSHEKDSAAVALFRHLFTRLVTLGEGAEDTRRIVTREELGQKEWALAQQLAGEDNRLVVTTATTTGQETVEVAHEALIRNWPALVDWVNRDRAFILWRSQLKQRVDEWRASPSDEGTLLRGGPLAVAEDWVTRRKHDLNEDEKAFVASSAAFKRRLEERSKQEHERRQRERDEEQERRVRDAEALASIRKQSNSRLRFAFVTISVLAVLAALGGILAQLQKAEATRQRADAQASQVDSKRNEAKATALLIDSRLAIEPDDSMVGPTLNAIVSGLRLESDIQVRSLNEYPVILSSLYRTAQWLRGSPTVTKIEHNNIVNVTGMVRFSKSGRLISVPTWSYSHPIIDGRTGIVQTRISIPEKIADSIELDETDTHAVVQTWGKIYSADLRSGHTVAPNCGNDGESSRLNKRPECDALAAIMMSNDQFIVVGGSNSLSILNIASLTTLAHLPEISRYRIWDGRLDSQQESYLTLADTTEPHDTNHHVLERRSQSFPRSFELTKINLHDKVVITEQFVLPSRPLKDPAIVAVDDENALLVDDGELMVVSLADHSVKTVLTNVTAIGRNVSNDKEIIADQSGNISIFSASGTSTNSVMITGCGSKRGNQIIVSSTKMIFFEHAHNSVCIYDRGDHSSLTWINPAGPIKYIDISRDSKELVVTSYDDTIALWNLSHLQELRLVRDSNEASDSQGSTEDKADASPEPLSANRSRFTGHYRIGLAGTGNDNIHLKLNYNDSIEYRYDKGRDLLVGSDAGHKLWFTVRHVMQKAKASGGHIKPDALARFAEDTSVMRLEGTPDLLVTQKGCTAIWAVSGSSWSPGSCLLSADDMAEVRPISGGPLVAGRDRRGHLFLWNPLKRNTPFLIADNFVLELNNPLVREGIPGMNDSDSWDYVASTEDARYLAIGIPSGEIWIARVEDGLTVAKINLKLQCDRFIDSAPNQGAQKCLQSLRFTGDEVVATVRVSQANTGDLVLRLERETYVWAPDPSVWRAQPSALVRYLSSYAAFAPYRRSADNTDDWCNAFEPQNGSTAISINDRRLFALRAMLREQERYSGNIVAMLCSGVIVDSWPSSQATLFSLFDKDRGIGALPKLIEIANNGGGFEKFALASSFALGDHGRLDEPLAVAEFRLASDAGFGTAEAFQAMMNPNSRAIGCDLLSLANRGEVVADGLFSLLGATTRSGVRPLILVPFITRHQAAISQPAIKASDADIVLHASRAFIHLKSFVDDPFVQNVRDAGLAILKAAAIEESYAVGRDTSKCAVQ